MKRRNFSRQSVKKYTVFCINASKHGITSWHVFCTRIVSTRLETMICRRAHVSQNGRSYNGEEKIMMRILIGYNGTDTANAALDDLLQAGLSDEAEVLVLSVAEVCCPPANVDEAAKQASQAANKIKKNFPNWAVTAETAAGTPSTEILSRAESFGPD